MSVHPWVDDLRPREYGLPPRSFIPSYPSLAPLALLTSPLPNVCPKVFSPLPYLPIHFLFLIFHRRMESSDVTETTLFRQGLYSLW